MSRGWGSSSVSFHPTSLHNSEWKLSMWFSFYLDSNRFAMFFVFITVNLSIITNTLRATANLTSFNCKLIADQHCLSVLMYQINLNSNWLSLKQQFQRQQVWRFIAHSHSYFVYFMVTNHCFPTDSSIKVRHTNFTFHFKIHPWVSIIACTVLVTRLQSVCSLQVIQLLKYYGKVVSDMADILWQY